MEQFNAVWERPEHLPSKAEITDPKAWMSRVLSLSLHPSVAAVRNAVRPTLAGAADPVLVACSGGADSLALLSAAIFEGHKLGAPGHRGDRRPRAPGGVGRARPARGRPDGHARRGRDGVGAGHRRGGRSRDRGRRARGAVRRAEPDGRPLRCGHGAARAHAGRPGRDRAPRAGPRLGRPLPGRDAPGVRPLPASAAGGQPDRHGDRLPGRGHRRLGRPAQPATPRSPGSGCGPGCSRSSRTSSGPVSPRPWLAPPTSSARTPSCWTRWPRRRTTRCASPGEWTPPGWRTGPRRSPTAS